MRFNSTQRGISQQGTNLNPWRVYERDIDILLAEEFATSRKFAEWFVREATGRTLKEVRVTNVDVSKVEHAGESDLLIALYDSVNDRDIGLFIENKIDAVFQPRQAERYHIRALNSVQSDIFSETLVVLSAPEKYLSAALSGSGFKNSISYESIAEFLETNIEGPRGRFRSKMLQNAATNSNQAWKRIDDIDTNSFWNEVFEIAAAEFPKLELKPRQLTKGSSWITTRPTGFPTSSQIDLKLSSCSADLTFNSVPLLALQATAAEFLEKDMSARAVGNSSAIRLAIPKIDVGEIKDDTHDRIRLTLAACERLVNLFHNNSDKFSFKT